MSKFGHFLRSDHLQPIVKEISYVKYTKDFIQKLHMERDKRTIRNIYQQTE